MAENFTGMVEPFLRLVDPSPVESLWPIVNLGPKALIGNFLLPNAVPEPVIHHMNIAAFLFCFFCTQRIRQCVGSFLLMSICLFTMYRMPKRAFPYTDASSWYMLVAVTACYPGCEFSLDFFLLVSFNFWLAKKFKEDVVKLYFVMCFAITTFYLIIIKLIAKRHSNATITESVENILNATGSNVSTTELVLVDEL